MSKPVFSMQVGPNVAQIVASFEKDPTIKPKVTVWFNDPGDPDIQVDCAPLSKVTPEYALMTARLLRAVVLEARRVAYRVRHMAGKSADHDPRHNEVIPCTSCEAIFQVTDAAWRPGVVSDKNGQVRMGYYTHCLRCRARVEILLVDDFSGSQLFRAPSAVAEAAMVDWSRSVTVEQVHDHLKKVFPPAHNALSEENSPSGHGFFVRKRGPLGIEVGHTGQPPRDEILSAYERHLARHYEVHRACPGLSVIPRLFVFPRERKARRRTTP